MRYVAKYLVSISRVDSESAALSLQTQVNNTRRFLLEWISFLHRYVPVGLLEVVPQQMNQRPPTHMVSLCHDALYELNQNA